jgi:hypothetical protein
MACLEHAFLPCRNEIVLATSRLNNTTVMNIKYQKLKTIVCSVVICSDVLRIGHLWDLLFILVSDGVFT